MQNAFWYRSIIMVFILEASLKFSVVLIAKFYCTIFTSVTSSLISYTYRLHASFKKKENNFISYDIDELAENINKKKKHSREIISLDNSISNILFGNNSRPCMEKNINAMFKIAVIMETAADLILNHKSHL